MTRCLVLVARGHIDLGSFDQTEEFAPRVHKKRTIDVWLRAYLFDDGTKQLVDGEHLVSFLEI